MTDYLEKEPVALLEYKKSFAFIAYEMRYRLLWFRHTNAVKQQAKELNQLLLSSQLLI